MRVHPLFLLPGESGSPGEYRCGAGAALTAKTRTLEPQDENKIQKIKKNADLTIDIEGYLG